MKLWHKQIMPWIANLTLNGLGQQISGLFLVWAGVTLYRTDTIWGEWGSDSFLMVTNTTKLRKGIRRRGWRVQAKVQVYLVLMSDYLSRLLFTQISWISGL